MTDCTIIAQPHPLRQDRVYCQARAGQTLRQMLGNLAHSCEVSIGGHAVPEKLWGVVRPKAGQQITVKVFPQGGDSNKWVRAILMIVLVVVTYGYAAPYAAAAWGGLTAAGWGAVIMAVGTLAINALVPPPGMNLGRGSKQDAYDPLQQITGTQNQAVPYGTIPCVIGQARFYPPHAALPYTEIVGSDQYLRMMLDLGYGDLDVSDVRIGNTPIDEYDDVEWEITTTPTLFTQDIAELQVGTALNDTSSSDLRVTQNPTDEISVEIAFGQGLFAVNKKGKNIPVSVAFDIEYREFGATEWLNAGNAPGHSASAMYWDFSGQQYVARSSARQLLRAGVRWRVPKGQYEVRITRGTTTVAENQAAYHDATWTVMRSISAQNPSTTGTLKLCVRIRATDQLNGVISTLNCVAAQKVRRFDSEMEELPAVASNNPAWVWLWLLTQCPATVRRLADDRVDIAAVAQWAAECEAKDYVIGTVADSGRNFGDLLRDVLACGRASFGVRNGKYAPVRDIAQTTPVQMFTPANSWGFSYSRSFAQPPHALRVKFKNPDQAGQVDVRTVYWDGYDEDNATRFEDLDLRMVDQPDAAWRLARYHLAVMHLRPVQYVLNADIEHLMIERGDLVHVAHDIIGWGTAWGRVRAVDGSTITVDNAVALESGKSYQFRVRSDDNTQDAVAITSPAGETSTLTLASAVDVQPGDLWVVGEVSRVVAPLIVRGVEPREDMKAALALVDAAPGVWTADSGTPPDFISEITGTPWCSPPEPPSVTIRPGDSAPDDGGVVTPDPGVGGDSGPGGLERGPVRGGNGTPVRPFQVRLQ